MPRKSSKAWPLFTALIAFSEVMTFISPLSCNLPQDVTFHVILVSICYSMAIWAFSIMYVSEFMQPKENFKSNFSNVGESLHINYVKVCPYHWAVGVFSYNVGCHWNHGLSFLHTNWLACSAFERGFCWFHVPVIIIMLSILNLPSKMHVFTMSAHVSL